MKLKPTYYGVRKYTFRSVWIILMAFSSFTAVNSQNLLTESFNYASGTLLTNANWLQLAAGAPSIAVSNGNLSRAGTIANDFGNKVFLASSGQDVYRSFTATALNATTPAVYASALVNVSAAQATGDYVISLNDIARLYIRSNGTGFSFGVMRFPGTVVYESATRSFNTNIRVVLKYEQIAGAANDIVKLYVDPPSGTEPSTADVSHTGTATDMTSVSYIVLMQGAAANAPTLEVDGITVGTTWASVTSAIYDYGDVPSSYDFTKDGVYVPAAHSLVSNFSLGSALADSELTPSSVSSGADNNGANGDGADEDAINIASNQIRKGVPYTLNVPVNNPSGTKYVYGWIDFNNNGKFEAGEFATVAFSATGSSTQVLTWLPAQTSTIADGTTKFYMRLRISDRILQDFTTTASGGADIDERSIGNGAVSTSNATDNGIIAKGEVEDYQIEVTNTFDYGDVPASFENDKDGNPLPALHAPLSGFTMGTLLDIESSPNNVAAGADNNETNGDGADEDGITSLTSVSRNVAYSITVPVNVPGTLTGTKYLYGWLDINGDGRFQIGEGTTTTISATGATNATLTWTAAQTALIPAGTAKIYARLRLSNLPLFDFNAGTNNDVIDERSIGNGATASNNAANALIKAFGEVEDYQLPVDLYDFGDAPIGYERPETTLVPARQISSIALQIGGTPDTELSAQNVAAGADNNGTNGDGLDEDGIDFGVSIISRGADFSLPVKVTNTTGASKVMYGWIDMNNNGVFENKEVASISVPANISNGTVSLTWTSANTSTIAASNVYLRLRLSENILTDNTATAAYDERAVGDGLSTGIYGVSASRGEIEDYKIKVRDQLVCLETANIPPTGVITANGVQVTSSFTGDVKSFSPAYTACGVSLNSGSLYVGQVNPWSVTLTFNKPVNDIILLLAAAGAMGNENFIFNSNGGTISIFSDNSCYSTITGNTINSGSTAPSGGLGGGGVFRISAPNAYTSLTINGLGGFNGSLLAICSSSIIPQPPIISSITPDEQTVCKNEVPAVISVSATGTGTLNYQWYSNTTNTNTGGTLIAGATSAVYTAPASAITGTNYYYVVITDNNASVTSLPVRIIINDCTGVPCYKPGATTGGATLISKVGITSLDRSMAQADNWPAVRNGAWLVLEAKTKGFVPNRLAFDASGNPVGIPAANFAEGMLVYDTTNKCLKVYTSTEGGTTFSWQCMNTQTCPD